jgi:EmrB/QacA subfamily drug resistance transporter
MSAPDGRMHPRAILAALMLAGTTYALLQSLVVPALPVMQRDLHASTTGIAWVFTSLLISTSVVTPIAGRLGDMFGKRLVLLACLGTLAIGSAMAALVHTLALLIAARALQGAGGAVFPLAFGIVRDEFPPQRVAGAIALLSAVLGVGGGVGIILGGPIITHLSWHWLFWIPCVVTIVALVATIVVVPESPVRAPGAVDWWGAVLLSAWLVALLLAVSEAPTWGWGSARTLGLLAVAAVLASVWVWAETRTRHPLVDMAVMRLRGIWTTNLVTLLFGFAMYSAFLLIPEYVQAPTSTGYGFGASVTEASLYLIPMTVAVMVFSLVAGRMSSTVGAKVPLIAGAALAAAAFVVLALASSSASIYVATTLNGAGIGFAFTAMSTLIVEAVPFDQTGVASGMNAIVRTIGGAFGAEIAASVLAANTLANGYPGAHGFTVVFSICAVVLLIGVGAAFAIPGRARQGIAKAPATAAAEG